MPVECHKVHGQPLELIRPLVELVDVLAQRPAGHLLQQRARQYGVPYLERAPKRFHATLGQVQRVLGHKRGLAAAGGPGEYGQLTAPVAAQQVVQLREALPLDALHLVDVLQVAEHVLAQRAESGDRLVQDRLRLGQHRLH